MQPHDMARYFLDLAERCADGVFFHRPDDDYRRRAAMLLFGTCAQESRFRYRRQIGVPDGIGGYGCCQVEPSTLRDHLDWLSKQNPEFTARVLSYVANDMDSDAIVNQDHKDLLRQLQTVDGDRLAFAFARIHYLRAPHAIPATVEEHAQYWKAYYNTVKGAGTPEEYVSTWNELCDSAWAEWEAEST